MKIDKLALSNFRSHEKTELELDKYSFVSAHSSPA